MAAFEYIMSCSSKGNLSKIVERLRIWIPGISEESLQVIETATTMHTLPCSNIRYHANVRQRTWDMWRSGRLMDATRNARCIILYGTNQTVNLATYVWVKIFELISRLKYTDACREVLIGT
ncbi:hypothetical protein PAAG_12284 [Paracoccidioides lutzii Pb01]|uniref:Uncharacterized protein n=1 Tax=Paracoccidioides lutzii (strain ATCC MYA-826 / Pb01) TaxID=502779 RepID=A0A0A2V0K4_PARBA|nr:hypothetical protein PAAG_12284 [Paracoccidioides lutzii Pb01]KGQ01033.1 hypothetical protein PAAG_12284 [Paracoccidioides lutzii Pb01]